MQRKPTFPASEQYVASGKSIYTNNRRENAERQNHSIKLEKISILNKCHF